jgi:phosphoribosylformylglycinamidine cyclo-ligase
VGWGTSWGSVEGVSGASYEDAGVAGQADALSAVARHLGPTLGLPLDGRLLTEFGQYASVLQVRDDLAIAISTDGVGSKTLVASALDRYDTIGFDCVAMNVNDILCVGARPLAMVDYLGVHTLDSRRADEILKGLGAAAKEASVAIPGGELAQLPEVIGSDGRSPGDAKAFDLVGTCIGMVHPAEIVLGDAIGAGDSLIGIASSGIHSNGLTLARRVLLDKGGYSLNELIGVLGRTLGEELLHPTEIYVRAVEALWDRDVRPHGLAHITSDGLANLCRLNDGVRFQVDALPKPQPIFELIRSVGSVEDAEMYRVFNMGTGFVAVVTKDDEERSLDAIRAAGYDAMVIGSVVSGEPGVDVRPLGLFGRLDSGNSSFTRA